MSKKSPKTDTASKKSSPKKSPKSDTESEKSTLLQEEQVEEELCDDSWSCDVIFLVENDLPSNNFINIFQQLKQIQKGIKSITKNDLLKDVKKKGGKKSSSKGQKKGKVQIPVELTDEQKIMKAVKENIAIPSESLASVIKKYMIIFKTEDINERKKLYNEFLQSQKKKKKPQTKASKKGRNQEESVPGDDKTVEETYVERPSLFIIISGFYEYDLPLELLKLNVPIRAVIKLKEKPHDTSTLDADVHNANHLESDKFNMLWLKFWCMYENLMNIPVNAELEKDVPVIIRKISDKVNDPAVNVKDKKAVVQNEIIEITQYVRKLLERHRNYINDVTTYELPTEIAPLEEASLYQTLTKMVPLECTLVSYVMYCIIEQVCYWNNEEVVNLESKFTQDKIIRGPTSTRQCSPVIITHNDEDLLKTFHLHIPEVNFRIINKNLLSTMPLLKEFKRYPKKSQMEKYFYEYHLQRLWKLIGNKNIGLNLFYIHLHWSILCKIKTYYVFEIRNKLIEKSKIEGEITSYISVTCNDRTTFCVELIDKWIDRFIRDSTFKSIYDDDDENVINDNKSDFRKSNTAVNDSENTFSDDVKGDKKLQCITGVKDVKQIKMSRKENLKHLRNFLFCFELLCLQETDKSPKTNNLFRHFIDYQYIEEMSSETMLQILQKSLLNFCLVENLFYPPTNKILLWFHNDVGIVFEENYSYELNTLLGFRDFYNDFILPEEIEEEHLKEEEVQSVIDSGLNEQSNQKKSDNNSILSEKENNVLVKSLSTCFNLGKTKVKVDLHKKTFISDDGSAITVEIDNWYKTSKMLRISINKIDTKLNIYKNMIKNNGLKITQDGQDNETFRTVLTLPNGTFVNIHVEENYNLDINYQKTSRSFIYNCFTVTLPNGLIIEVIKNKLNNNEIYIKQSYLSKGPDHNKIWDEKCRYFLKTGTILSFKNDETIDVIYNNSVKTNIKSIVETFVDEIVLQSSPETPEPEVESTDNKSKTSPKSSKKKKAPKLPAEEITEPKILKKLVYEVPEHSVRSWSGINYEFKNEVCTEIIDNNVNLRTIFNPYSQLFIDRNDGVKSVLNEDGHLISDFSDGTKLSTYFYEEETGIQMSDEKVNEMEYSRFQSMDFSRRSTSSSLTSAQYNLHEFNYTDSEFVSVKLGCLMEHPNYARVEYLPFDDSIELTLPDEITIKLNETSDKDSYNFTVSAGTKMKALFKNDSIEFTSNIYKKSNQQNVTIVKPLLEDDELQRYVPYFCKTFDSFGNIFLVNEDGDVKLINTKTEMDPALRATLQKYPHSNLTCNESYFNDQIPKSVISRFFVVNENYSGYEIIGNSDLTVSNEEDNQRYNNTKVINNPTNGRINSKMRQHLIYKTHSEHYIMPYKIGPLSTIFNKFQRLHLSPTWTPSQSPWFLIRSRQVKRHFRRFSLTDMARHDDKRIIAVVLKTVQKVMNKDEFNGLNIILTGLEKLNSDNEEIFKKYRSQSFTDFEIDARLRETQELINKIKIDFPKWSIIKKDCDICKQKFGQLKVPEGEPATHGLDTSESFECVINKFDYNASCD